MLFFGKWRQSAISGQNTENGACFKHYIQVASLILMSVVYEPYITFLGFYVVTRSELPNLGLLVFKSTSF